ncbi:MAG TPA: hypothetical protein VFN67_36410 [Polyangiales bacterium]|nr:hypothetical protein [Polyangiales bacterium]
MSAAEQTQPPQLPPPKVGAYIAALIEIGILATFVSYHSWLGIALCAAYAWFTSTWMLLEDFLRR